VAHSIYQNKNARANEKPEYEIAKEATAYVSSGNSITKNPDTYGPIDYFAVSGHKPVKLIQCKNRDYTLDFFTKYDPYIPIETLLAIKPYEGPLPRQDELEEAYIEYADKLTTINTRYFDEDIDLHNDAYLAMRTIDGFLVIWNLFDFSYFGISNNWTRHGSPKNRRIQQVSAYYRLQDALLLEKIT